MSNCHFSQHLPITDTLDRIDSTDEDPDISILRYCTINIVIAHAITLTGIISGKLECVESNFPVRKSYSTEERYVIAPVFAIYDCLYQDIMQAVNDQCDEWD